MNKTLPLGKIPPDLLAEILDLPSHPDPDLVQGPGIGLDCAVIDLGDRYLVLKSDPITFASQEIGWYAVQVNANDIATSGARPRWFLATTLFPEGQTTPEEVLAVNLQLREACRSLGIALVGGHSEITSGIDRTIVAGTMLGVVEAQDLVKPSGATPGDQILLTKSVPIEATAILGKEFGAQLEAKVPIEIIREGAAYLQDPGISVLQDAFLATQAGRVTAMHDPTEGGLKAALWELAQACGHCLEIQVEKVPVTQVSRLFCQALGVDPLAAIASGALLLTASADEAPRIIRELESNGISCSRIGRVKSGKPSVVATDQTGSRPLDFPERDEIARLFEG